MRRLNFFVALLLLCAGSQSFASHQDEIVARVTGNIICPCGTNCANLLVKNCECATAVQMAREIRKLVEEGKTEQEIYAIYEKKYGPSMLAAPKMQGFNVLAWVLPFIGLALGCGVVVVVVKKLKQDTSTDQASTASQIDEKYRKLLEKEMSE